MCPIVYALDVWGDPWSLVVLRDVLIHGKRHYRQFLGSEEGIATNVLSAKLASLVAAGLLEKVTGHMRADTMYLPTQKAFDLLPVIFAVMRWGIEHNPHADASGPVMQQLLHDPDGLARRLLDARREELASIDR
jgi:DNA-binding HxlR family transcriptional regulator